MSLTAARGVHRYALSSICFDLLVTAAHWFSGTVNLPGVNCQSEIVGTPVLGVSRWPITLRTASACMRWVMAFDQLANVGVAKLGEVLPTVLLCLSRRALLLGGELCCHV